MDYLGYKDKVCVVTGAASGIGKATAELLVELGAKVYAIDINEVNIPGIKNYIRADLCNKDAIDMAFEEIPKQIDSFFGVAGVSGIKTNYYTTFTINYIANKYITENYLKKRMDCGSAIVYVTSGWAKNWEKYYKEFIEFTRAKTWNEMMNALHNQAKETTLGIMAYPLSKRALTYYMAEEAIELARRGIRVNSLVPGNCDTPLVEDYAKMHGGVDKLIDEAGIIGRLANPQEIAEPLVFLNSDMARFISGYPMVVDFGYDTLVNLGVKKDKTNMKVGSRFYNLDFMQRMLAERVNLNFVNTNVPYVPSQPVVNTIMESSNTTEFQVIQEDYLNTNNFVEPTDTMANEIIEEEEIL